MVIMVSRKVDFPAPFFPMTPMISPAYASKSIPFKTLFVPYDFCKLLMLITDIVTPPMGCSLYPKYMCFSVPSHRDYSDTLEKRRNLQKASAEMNFMLIENEGNKRFITVGLYTEEMKYESIRSSLS